MRSPSHAVVLVIGALLCAAPGGTAKAVPYGPGADVLGGTTTRAYVGHRFSGAEAGSGADATPTQARPIDQLERAVAADPENLKLAADYRQAVIADQTFDRSIDFLDKLAKRKDSGPNVYISLALAYVDKVPTSGDIRRLYLGRDAMSALTKAIDRQPSMLAYYLRGVINLFYNRFIFNRVSRGIADLEHALTLVTPDTPPALVRRTYTSLGDGHSKQGNAVRAREAWTLGLQTFPGDADLQKRLAPGADLYDIVTTALYAGRRIDTTLRDLLPAR